MHVAAEPALDALARALDSLLDTFLALGFGFVATYSTISAL